MGSIPMEARMPRRGQSLTVAQVRAAKPGRYGDGGGLFLLVRDSGARFWSFRYVRTGKMREMGLGAASGPNMVPLATARAAAKEHWTAFKAGGDPLAKRHADHAAALVEAKAEALAMKTFGDVVTDYLTAHEGHWRNVKHRQQWRNTLDTYVAPTIGSLPVAEVTTSHVTEILTPIWNVKAETAARVRGRVEAVLDYATAREWRTGDNPARWRGHMAVIMGKRSKANAVKHHAALPYAEVAGFMAELVKRSGLAPIAMQFIILTAARSGEVLGATWREIDLAGMAWTVPGARMKAGREHRVPLSGAALALLQKVAPLRPAKDGEAAYLFPGARPGRPLSNMATDMLLRRMKRDDITTHGFRSSFRDWCAEQTSYPGEMAEAALAHTVRDKVEAAYRRGDLFERRRAMMEEWAGFVRSDPRPASHQSA